MIFRQSVFREWILGLVILGSVLFLSPKAYAAPGVDENKALLEQIVGLVRVVNSLEGQLLLQASQSASLVSVDKQMVGVQAETEYLVLGGVLLRLDKVAEPRKIDQQIFDFLKEVWGKEVVAEKVNQFRVFYDTEMNLDAYVETREVLTKKTIVGVNREWFDLEVFANKQAMARLLVHEYAHIIFSERPDLVKNFVAQFWTIADKNREQEFALLSNEIVFSKLDKGFDSSRFVSSYAALSSDEDLAETFVDFVLKAKPNGNSVKEQKIKSFYLDSELVKERTRLRDNLERVGAR